AGRGRGAIGSGRVAPRVGRLSVPERAAQLRPARDEPATRIRRGGVMPHGSAFSIPSGRRTAQTLIVYVEDQPGTLNRIVSLFRRRGFNIESLTVGRSEREGISRITVVVRADDETARRLEANLDKLVNVLSVGDVTHAPSVTREMAFVS